MTKTRFLGDFTHKLAVAAKLWVKSHKTVCLQNF